MCDSFDITITRHSLPPNYAFIDARVRGAVIGIGGANVKRITDTVGDQCHIRIVNTPRMATVNVKVGDEVVQKTVELKVGSLEISAESREAVAMALKMVKQDEAHFLDPKVPLSKPTRNIPYGELVMGMGPLGYTIFTSFPEVVVVGSLIGKGGKNHAVIRDDVGDGANFIHHPQPDRTCGIFELTGNSVKTIDRLIQRMRFELKRWYGRRQATTLSVPIDAPAPAPATGFAVLAEDDGYSSDEAVVDVWKAQSAAVPAPKPVDPAPKPVEKPIEAPHGMVVLKKEETITPLFSASGAVLPRLERGTAARRLPTVVRPSAPVIETGFEDTRSIERVRLMERIKKAIFVQLRQAHIERVGTTEIRDKRTGEKKLVPKEPFEVPSNFREMVDEVFSRMTSKSAKPASRSARGLSEKDFAVSLSSLAPSAGAWSSKTTSALKEELAAATEAGVGFVETEKARVERLERERREREEEEEFVRIKKAKKDARAGVKTVVVETVAVDVADFDREIAEAMASLGISSAPVVEPAGEFGVLSDADLEAEWTAFAKSL